MFKELTINLWTLIDNLRSQLAKNAILTLSDCFTFLPESYITDQVFTNSYTKLIKKTTDTNVFIA
jgi:hypothetical protein